MCVFQNLIRATTVAVSYLLHSDYVWPCFIDLRKGEVRTQKSEYKELENFF